LVRSPMKALKLGLYVVLLALVVVFFQKFRSEYQVASAWAASAAERKSRAGDTPETNRLDTASAESQATNNGSTNLGFASLPDSATNELNSAGAATNGIAAAESSTNAPLAPTNAPVASRPAGSPQTPGGSWPLSLGAFVLSLILLGGFGAWEFARSVASRAHATVFMEDEEDDRDPEYDLAEAAWKRGEFLEAVNLMRDYLNKNPTEVQIGIRIAEIYEKDLNNPVAAAMELEDVLAKKLPGERWGWTAIRLANLYSGRLGQPDKALALLNRIITEHPDTGAARKARSRLGLPESDEEIAASTVPSHPLPTAEEEPDPGASDSNLPRGFRPKK
jgi:TolA-binding protein